MASGNKSDIPLTPPSKIDVSQSKTRQSVNETSFEDERDSLDTWSVSEFEEDLDYHRQQNTANSSADRSLTARYEAPQSETQETADVLINVPVTEVSTLQRNKLDSLMVEIEIAVSENPEAAENVVNQTFAFLGCIETSVYPWLMAAKTESTMLLILDSLLRRGISLSKVDRLGNTPLHFAAKKDWNGVAKVMIDCQPDITKRNRSGETPLSISIERRNDEISAKIISRMANIDVRVLFYGNIERRREFSLCELVSLKMEQTVLAVLDSAIDIRRLTGSIYVDYTILEADGSGESPDHGEFNPACRSPFQAIALQGNTKLVSHDAIRLLSQKKWNESGRNLFLKNVIFYILAWCCLCTSAIMAAMTPDPSIYNTPRDIVRAVFESIAVLYVLKKLIIEICQLRKHRFEYFKDIFNLIDIGAAIFLLIVPILRFTDVNAHWHVFSLSFLIWTTRIIKYTVVQRDMGAYTKILTRVLVHDFIRFGVLFSITLFAFSVAFSLSLRGDSEQSKINETR